MYQFVTGSRGSFDGASGLLPASPSRPRPTPTAHSPAPAVSLSGAGAGAAREWAGVGAAPSQAGAGPGTGAAAGLNYQWRVNTEGDGRGIEHDIDGIWRRRNTDEERHTKEWAKGEMQWQGRRLGDDNAAGAAQNGHSSGQEAQALGRERKREEGGQEKARPRVSVLEDCPSRILSPPSPPNPFRPHQPPASSQDTQPAKAAVPTLRLPVRLPPPPPQYSSPPVTVGQNASPHPSGILQTPSTTPFGHGLSTNASGVVSAEDVALQGKVQGGGARAFALPPHQRNHEPQERASPATSATPSDVSSVHSEVAESFDVQDVLGEKGIFDVLEALERQELLSPQQVTYILQLVWLPPALDTNPPRALSAAAPRARVCLRVYAL